MEKPSELRVVFKDNRLDGMRYTENFNWTGHVFVCPLTQIDKVLKRDEAKRTGVYILFGGENRKKTVYVGETAKKISNRLRDHRKKDWWEDMKEVILVTTTNQSLESTHVKYLQASIYKIIKDESGVDLLNDQEPSFPKTISESSKEDMEVFLNTFQKNIKPLNVGIFSNKKTYPGKDANSGSSTSPILKLVSKRNNSYEARAFQKRQSFIVKKSSLARGRWEGSMKHGKPAQDMRDKLKKEGILVREGENLRFTKNFPFKSPSIAAGVIMGRNAGGLVEWRVEESNQTLKDWRYRK